MLWKIVLINVIHIWFANNELQNARPLAWSVKSLGTVTLLKTFKLKFTNHFSRNSTEAGMMLLIIVIISQLDCKNICLMIFKTTIEYVWVDHELGAS